MSRLTLVAIQEALEIADYRQAVAIVTAALDGDEPKRDRAWCSVCKRGFEWPGLRDAHRQFCTAREMAA